MSSHPFEPFSNAPEERTSGSRRHTHVFSLPDASTKGDTHESVTLEWIGRHVARLCELPYAGSHSHGTARSDGFAVPEDTLTRDQADVLRLIDETDFFGGVVPHAFVATKAISHPLLSREADAPPHWHEALGHALAGTTLPGFTVFSLRDARQACERLLPLGDIRAKLAAGKGGDGQRVLRTRRDCEIFFEQHSTPEGFPKYGACIELDLSESTTYSVGEFRLAGLSLVYVGTQKATRDAQGRAVYGGSRIEVVRGNLADLAAAFASTPFAGAITLTRRYDSHVRAAYPDLMSSRCNYDVISGVDSRGNRRLGVLEQSWRVGGATAAELGALECFIADPSTQRVIASTHEHYGKARLPDGAEVYCAMDDPHCGPITKYRMIKAYGSQTRHD